MCGGVPWNMMKEETLHDPEEDSAAREADSAEEKPAQPTKKKKVLVESSLIPGMTFWVTPRCDHDSEERDGADLRVSPVDVVQLMELTVAPEVREDPPVTRCGCMVHGTQRRDAARP